MPCVSHCYLVSVHKILTFYIQGVLKFKCPNSWPEHIIFFSPVRPFASLMDFSQSALFLGITFLCLIFYLLISVCAEFHHLFFGRNIILRMAKSTGETRRSVTSHYVATSWWSPPMDIHPLFHDGHIIITIIIIIIITTTIIGSRKAAFAWFQPSAAVKGYASKIVSTDPLVSLSSHLQG